MTQKPILKQFGDLTLTDFLQYPVWVSVHGCDYGEPWYDETDEATFRPWTGPLPVDPSQDMFLVRAYLTLADGRVFPGFITPQHQDEMIDFGTIQPHVFLPSGKLYGFWDGMFKRSEEKRQVLYSELGQDPGNIFPIRFSAERGLTNGLDSGLIHGFYWQPGDKLQEYL